MDFRSFSYLESFLGCALSVLNLANAVMVVQIQYTFVTFLAGKNRYFKIIQMAATGSIFIIYFFFTNFVSVSVD